jgi:D-3-phosphoglycerate dehydrogenase
MPLEPLDDPSFAPRLALSRTVGRIFASVVHGPVTRLGVETTGRLTDPEPFCREVACGFLMRTLQRRVTPDDARQFAAEHGLEVTGRHGERSGALADELTWTAASTAEEWTLRGALSLRGEPVLTEANGFCFELVPAHTLLFVRNDDVPGVVGRLGTFLGALGINIEEMRLLTRPGDPLAFSALRLAAPLSPDQLADLGRLPNLVDARQAVLPPLPVG